MRFGSVNRKALTSFIIFCIVLLKDVLVSDLKLIPVRAPINRLISWLFILPITIIGIVFSIQVIRKKYLNRDDHFLDINLFLALPILLYVLYVLLG